MPVSLAAAERKSSAVCLGTPSLTFNLPFFAIMPLMKPTLKPPIDLTSPRSGPISSNHCGRITESITFIFGLFLPSPGREQVVINKGYSCEPNSRVRLPPFCLVRCDSSLNGSEDWIPFPNCLSRKSKIVQKISRESGEGRRIIVMTERPARQVFCKEARSPLFRRQAWEGMRTQSDVPSCGGD